MPGPLARLASTTATRALRGAVERGRWTVGLGVVAVVPSVPRGWGLRRRLRRCARRRRRLAKGTQARVQLVQLVHGDGGLRHRPGRWHTGRLAPLREHPGVQGRLVVAPRIPRRRREGRESLRLDESWLARRHGAELAAARWKLPLPLRLDETWRARCHGAEFDAARWKLRLFVLLWGGASEACIRHRRGRKPLVQAAPLLLQPCPLVAQVAELRLPIEFRHHLHQLNALDRLLEGALKVVDRLDKHAACLRYVRGHARDRLVPAV
mmetsp:Transcript_11867/g.33534  ORF Transcript_11867/g.33534 Transcript_11867/m.33534 type:complete len:266 (+) Transcript_11867:234-1031(+)